MVQLCGATTPQCIISVVCLHKLYAYTSSIGTETLITLLV